MISWASMRACSGASRRPSARSASTAGAPRRVRPPASARSCWFWVDGGTGQESASRSAPAAPSRRMPARSSPDRMAAIANASRHSMTPRLSPISVRVRSAHSSSCAARAVSLSWDARSPDCTRRTQCQSSRQGPQSGPSCPQMASGRSRVAPQPQSPPGCRPSTRSLPHRESGVAGGGLLLGIFGRRRNRLEQAGHPRR